MDNEARASHSVRGIHTRSALRERGSIEREQHGRIGRGVRQLRRRERPRLPVGRLLVL